MPELPLERLEPLWLLWLLELLEMKLLELLEPPLELPLELPLEPPLEPLEPLWLLKLLEPLLPRRQGSLGEVIRVGSLQGSKEVAMLLAKAPGKKVMIIKGQKASTFSHLPAQPAGP